jgi:hypothetical protein
VPVGMLIIEATYPLPQARNSRAASSLREAETP